MKAETSFKNLRANKRTMIDVRIQTSYTAIPLQDTPLTVCLKSLEEEDYEVPKYLNIQMSLKEAEQLAASLSQYVHKYGNQEILTRDDLSS
jgi:sugar diacid utilization regulator